MFYKVIQKKGFGKNKFYASNYPQTSVSFKELVEKTSSSHGIFSGDVIRVVYALQETVFRELSKGNIVRLGDLGSFRLVVKSDGVLNPNDVNAKCIREVKVQFQVTRKFKSLFGGVKWKKK